ncbi:RNA polymerase sigma24 factor [Actinoplanes sp. SE50]|uniref:RNA polymerase sigma factor n=1 Tax=unclassified Actinoplanes TaxID=2626549 RepID=UPI00023EC8DE|nr:MULTISPECIES: SigE family RNA polymerase sigma factor [unclassified Actinoplanes]AEV82009.1 RNA polymerase sigma factor sigW [Actinoplanes sp. SE50/110]ATO80408.1 RNA polymerase sigma24 factor [Actinoplanes sp. SE50]SLL97815.1 RNA polymerase sigma24 factor [Actinoplanes sp. SE50/110]
MAGDDSADFDTFYAATVRRVLLYAYASCGDRAEAQDVAHEAFARAWQHWSRVSRYDDPEGWVRVVASRLLINRWRGLRRWVAARARLGPPDDVAGGPSPDRVAVAAALQRLPKAQREVVTLYYLLDMPVRDIAESLGVPEGTVKVRLSRARAALAQLLGDNDQEISDVTSRS